MHMLPAWDIPAVDVVVSEDATRLREASLSAVESAFKCTDKMERNEQRAALRAQVAADFHKEGEALYNQEIDNIVSRLEKEVVRSSILSNKPRIDGRDLTTVRPINIDVSYLPRAHGSTVFTRGETQALVATTLGSGRDAQEIEVGAEVVRENHVAL